MNKREMTHEEMMEVAKNSKNYTEFRTFCESVMECEFMPKDDLSGINNDNISIGDKHVTSINLTAGNIWNQVQD